MFQCDITTTPYVVAYWSNFVDNLNWKNIWTLPYKYVLTNKVREVSFKILHRYYPAKHYLLKFKKDICVNCSFCEVSPETMVHLFWQCSYSNKFWKDVSRYIIDNIYSDFALCWENVLLGFVNHKSNKHKEFFVINLIIILAKFHIHKSKFSHKKPLFLIFENETKQ